MPKSVKFSAWVWRRCLRWMSERFVCTSACLRVCVFMWHVCVWVRVSLRHVRVSACVRRWERVRPTKCEWMCVFSRGVWVRIDSLCWIRLGKRRFLFLLSNFLFLFSSVSDLLRSQEVKHFNCFVNLFSLLQKSKNRSNSEKFFSVKFETSVFSRFGSRNIGRRRKHRK